jgi:hypothetical protein
MVSHAQLQMAMPDNLTIYETPAGTLMEQHSGGFGNRAISIAKLKWSKENTCPALALDSVEQ